MKTEETRDGELQELTHEAVPGYIKALCIVSLVGLLYMAVIFIRN